MAKTRAARRAAAVTVPAAEPVAIDLGGIDLVRRAADEALLARSRWNVLTERAVVLGRAEGVSWDSLGLWLNVPGETLRRRYGRAAGAAGGGRG